MASRARSLVLVLALALAIPPVASALPPVARQPVCQPFAEAPSATVRVRWTGVTRTPGCWFFSGPGDLGRDDRLGETATWSRSGDRVTLRFGRAAFEGTIASGRVTLRRTSRHDSWTVTETIVGTLAGGECPTLTARYHYDECDDGTPCPGHCHLDASVALSSPSSAP